MGFAMSEKREYELSCRYIESLGIDPVDVPRYDFSHTHYRARVFNEEGERVFDEYNFPATEYVAWPEGFNFAEFDARHAVDPLRDQIDKEFRHFNRRHEAQLLVDYLTETYINNKESK